MMIFLIFSSPTKEI